MTPNKASLQAELAAIKRELAAMTKKRDEALAIRDASIRFYDETKENHERLRSHLRPVLAYFGQQWIGDAVRADFRALVTFCERTRR